MSIEGNPDSLSERIGRETLECMIEGYVSQTGDKEISKKVEQVFSSHLLHMVEKGIVTSHDSLPNRHMHLKHSWNVMCGTETNTYYDQAGGALEIARRLNHPLIIRPLMMLAFDLRKDKVTNEQREEKLVRIMEEMDQGDVAHWNFGAREEDAVSGDKFEIEMRQWALIFGTWQQGVRSLLPAEDVSPIRIHEVEIEIPTGRLLISDWFQDPGFTNLVDEGNPWRGTSQRENESDAERYAQNHGFVSVASATRCLAIFQRGNTLTIGRHDEEGDHPAPKGYARRSDMVIDLRKVTLVDQEVLKSILLGIHGEHEGLAVLEKIIEDHDTKKVQVAPGRYVVRSSGRGYIKDLLGKDDSSNIGGYEPVLDFRRKAA